MPEATEIANRIWLALPMVDHMALDDEPWMAAEIVSRELPDETYAVRHAVADALEDLVRGDAIQWDEYGEPCTDDCTCCDRDPDQTAAMANARAM